MSLLSEHAAVLRAALDEVGRLEEPMRAAAQAVADALRGGGKVLAAGNGGSAAEAQHLTAELLGRLHPARDRNPLPAVALHADTSTITAVGNDYGYEQIFARQVAALGRPGDVLVVLSTSGGSKNLVAAVDTAKRQGLATIGLLGAGSKPLHERCTHVLAVPSENLQATQECHLLLLHVLVEEAENLLGLPPEGAIAREPPPRG